MLIHIVIDVVMKLKQTVITEKELIERWLNAEAHLRYNEHICKHGVVNAGDRYCKVCLKESML